jgi:hypothetical protein
VKLGAAKAGEEGFGMPDSRSDASSNPPARRGIRLPGILRRRWVTTATAVVVGVNAILLVSLSGLGSAATQQCGGGGSGSGGSGGSGGEECYADLSLKIVQSVKTIPVGQRLFYLMMVKNNGPSFAYGIHLLALLPADTSLQWGLTSGEQYGGDYCLLDQRLHVADCFMDYLDAGQTTAVTLILVPKKAGIITTRAGVSEQFPKDPNKKNNTATIETTVTP